MPPKKKTAEATTEPENVNDGPSPAQAAADEVSNTDLKIEFRGGTFTVPRARTQSLHFQMALSSLEYAAIMTETLDKAQQFQLLSLVDRGENTIEVAAEYLAALSKAGGWGNSPSSG